MHPRLILGNGAQSAESSCRYARLSPTLAMATSSVPSSAVPVWSAATTVVPMPSRRTSRLAWSSTLGLDSSTALNSVDASRTGAAVSVSAMVSTARREAVSRRVRRPYRRPAGTGRSRASRGNSLHCWAACTPYRTSNSSRALNSADLIFLRFYRITKFTSLSGTQMILVIVLPVRSGLIFSSAKASLSRSAAGLPKGTTIRLRSLPLICTTTSASGSRARSGSYLGQGCLNTGP